MISTVVGLLAAGLLPIRAGQLRSAGDPLGPVDGGPDGPRDLACELTASDVRCSPAVPEAPDRPDFPDAPEIGGPDSGSVFGFGNLLVVLLVAALIVVLAWIIVTIIRNRAPIDVEESDDLDESLDELADERIVDVERPPDRWRRAAEKHRGAGSFRDAVRCEYRALVGDLARSGHVDEIPGRTSGEEREQLRSLAPQVAPAFDLAADIFDAAWFDDAEVTADHDRRFVAAATAVLDQVMSKTGSQGSAR